MDRGAEDLRRVATHIRQVEKRFAEALTGFAAVAFNLPHDPVAALWPSG